MKRSHIFTIPDDTLIKDGSVDPMGMQMIWTYFGQQVFQNKLTTVSTDIRNYTINLIHHLILHKFQQERNDYFVKARNHFPGYTSDYDVKAGLLIFMEDILAYSLMDQKETVDTRGVLGSSNASDLLTKHQGNFQNIEIHAEKRHGVLVRQIQLGVSGRYKGPFMNMGLMSTTFEYNPIEFERIQKLIERWPAAVTLIDRLLAILCALVNESSGSYPIDKLDKYLNDDALMSLYSDCFGSVEVNELLKSYWEEKLGLKEGAAEAVYNQVKEGNQVNASVLLGSAMKELEEEAEKEKIKQIIDVEPLLTRCVHAFYLLADTSIKKTEDVYADLKELLKNLPLENIKYLRSASPRLNQLYTYIKDVQNDPDLFAQGILNYHKKIMEDRGGAAWVELDRGQVKHNIHQSTNKTTYEITNEGYWYHEYYIGAMHSIHNGLNPN